MAVWKYVYKTVKGMNLDLKLIGRNNLPLKLTRAMSGSGKVSPTQLMDLVDIIDPVQELQMLDAVECIDENNVKIPIILRNSGVDKKYDMYQIGVYALDPDIGEILYIVLQSDGAEEIPSEIEMKDFKLEWYINVSVNNAENVEVVINEAGVLNVEQGDARYVSQTDYKIMTDQLMSSMKNNEKILEEHATDTLVHVSADEKREWDESLDSAKEYSNEIYQQATGYTDQKIADLIGGAPENIGALSTPASLKGSLDDYKNPGFYYAVGGNKVTEKPQGVDSFGLLVTREGNLNRGQLLFSSRKEIGTYTRRWDSDSNVWTEWVQLVDSDGNAVSATKATYDENGYRITGYLKHDGDASDITVNFTSADSEEPSEWTDVALLKNTNKFWGIFNRISIMFRNVRYLYKMLGTTDISHVGNGTVTGALNELNARTNYPIVRISASITDYVDSINEGFGFFIINTNAQTAGVPNANYTYTTGYYAKINNGTSKIVIFSRGTNDSIVKTKYITSEWSDWFSFA